MPGVKYVASKYLAQKWETERFRIHKMRVNNAFPLVDMSSPKQYPHLKLGVNKIAVEEEKLARYDRENQMLMNKIRVIVRGSGSIDNWNTWSRKDLHAAARLKQQREIELQNQAMLQRLRKTKPVIQKKKQEQDYMKHKGRQEMMERTTKEYKSPRQSLSSMNNSEGHSDERTSEESVKDEVRAEKMQKCDSLDEDSEEEQEENMQENSENKKENTTSRPPLPPQKKSPVNRSKPPPENSKKNRRADVPKLPAI